jgi:hypothetical protein
MHEKLNKKVIKSKLHWRANLGPSSIAVFAKAIHSDLHLPRKHSNRFLADAVPISTSLSHLACIDVELNYRHGFALSDALRCAALRSDGSFLQRFFGDDWAKVIFKLPEVRSHLWRWLEELRPSVPEVSRIRDDLSLSFGRYHALYSTLGRAHVPWLPPLADVQTVHDILNEVVRERLDLRVVSDNKTAEGQPTGEVTGAHLSLSPLISTVLEYVSLYSDTIKTPLPHTFPTAESQVREFVGVEL